MSSIGSYSFIKMDGPPMPTLGADVELLGEREYIDGTAWRLAATKGSQLEVRTVAGVNLVTDANTLESNYQALRGTQVTVIDDLGQTRNNVLIQGVRVIGKQRVLKATASSVNYLVTAVWAMVAVE